MNTIDSPLLSTSIRLSPKTLLKPSNSLNKPNFKPSSTHLKTPLKSPENLTFSQKDAYPMSLLLQSKSPHAIYSDNQTTPSRPTQTHFRTRLKSPKKKPFSEKDAFPMSLPLHTKNPHAIFSDIQRFARQGKLKEALTILDYCDQQGIPVNPTTFSSLLRACVESKSLTHGKQIHVHIRINGLENNEFLRTKLVHMYTSCGSLEDARGVFDGVSSKSVYTWNALLRGNVISGRRHYREALSTYSEMRELGVELNVYSFSCMIKSFAGATAFRQGLKAHALLIKNGLVDSSILRTSLIDMYFKCGKIKLARLMFEEIVERDVVVWGAMIAGFGHNRLQREALEYLQSNVPKI